MSKLSKRLTKHTKRREETLALVIEAWVENLGDEEKWGDLDPWTSDRLYLLAARAAQAVMDGAREAGHLADALGAEPYDDE